MSAQIPGATWEAIAAWLRRLARSRVAGRDVEDVVADVLLDMLMHVEARKPLRSPLGLASAILRKRVDRLRRVHGRLDFRATQCLDALPSPEDRPAQGQAQTNPGQFDPRILRGRREREVAARVQAGATCSLIAKDLGMPAKQVRRVVLRVAAKLASRNSGSK